MSAEVATPDILIFTDNAANKVRELIEEEGNPELKLRVFVSGGGCSGFQYGFGLFVIWSLVGAFFIYQLQETYCRQQG